MRTFSIGRVIANNNNKIFIIAGPCQIESQDHAEFTAGTIKEICDDLDIDLIYKSSFDKANRSSIGTQRGIGIDEGLKILNSIKHEFGIPVLTDIHESYQAQLAADAGIDVLQIPAFLCRQTDLLLAAGDTGCAINVKKGQFLAPWDMRNVAAKLEANGCQNYFFTERGTTFGYNNLVADMRAIPWMQEIGCPVIFDATHSVQRPGGAGETTGGDGKLAPVLARAAVAAGCDGVFLETHENPALAFSDGPNQVPLEDLPGLIRQLKAIRDAVL